MSKLVQASATYLTKVINRGRWYHVSAAVSVDTDSIAQQVQTRWAGRRRFYRDVDVDSVESPWLTTNAEPARTSHADGTVSSPVSAGVDGTSSPTGVMALSPHKNTPDSSSRAHLLSPRSPTYKGPSEMDYALPPSTWYGVTLDKKVLRTPAGRVLAVPSKTLAYAVAAEWQAVRDRIQPTQLPLTTLVCTALDQTCLDPVKYRESALRFLGTDTICYYSDPLSDRELYQQQAKLWDPIHSYFAGHHLCTATGPPATVYGVDEGVQWATMRLRSRQLDDQTIPTQVVSPGLPHPPSLVKACRNWVSGLDAWHLTILSSCASETKSFLLSFALLQPDAHKFFRRLPGTDENADLASSALQASRLEEEYQIAQWGMVEGQHDYDRLNGSIQLRSGLLLMQLLRYAG
jgi:ATP synthase mitochondrial F1 complex assembly factor 2